MLRSVGPRQETVGTGRFETFLRRLLSIKGIVAPTVEPKLSAGFDLIRPPWELSENALLAGWRGVQSYATVGPVAGAYSQLNLDNPVGSGMVLVVERVVIGSVAASFGAFWNLSPTVSMAASAATARMDGRGTAGTPAPAYTTGVFTTGTTVAALVGRAMYTWSPASAVTREFAGPWVVPPGMSLIIQSSAVNVQIGGGFVWWERAAEPSELAAA